MRRSTLLRSAGPTVAAAPGGVLVRRDDLGWFDGLRGPRLLARDSR